MALSLTPQQILDKGEYRLLVTAPHWGRVRLGDVATVQNGAAFKSKYFSQDDGVPLIRIRDVGKSVTDSRYTGPYDDVYLVYPGDLIIGMDGDFRAALWSGEIGLLNQRVCRVSLQTDLMDRGFLFLCLQPFLDAIHAETSSVTVKHLSSRTVADIPLPFPPLDEQRRIVAKIEELFSELDQGVESLKTARAQLQTYRQSLLKAAFEGRLTEQWRRENAERLGTADQLLERIREEREARYQRQLEEWQAAVAAWEAEGKPGRKPRKPTAEKPAPTIEPNELEVLPRIPAHWHYVRLVELASVGSGLSVSKARKVADPVEVPYLRVANVQRGRLVLDEIKTMPVERVSLDELRLRQWDILFNEGGDRDKLGRGWVWEGQIDPCITQNHVFRATTFLGDEFHAKFISHWGNVFGRDYFEKVGKQTTNLASINKTVLKMFPVPVPPYEEQCEIVRLIEELGSQVAEMETQIEDGLSRADILRQSILKRAFEGRLVPQDPDDEPAAVLLERIRAERETDSKPAGRRGRKAEATA